MRCWRSPWSIRCSRCSFSPSPKARALHLRRFTRSSPRPISSRRCCNTLIISVLTVIFAGTVGITLAWLIARSNMPFRRLFDPLNMIPFYLSSVVGALSWQIVAAPRSGILNELLKPIFGGPVFDIYSVGGIALVLGSVLLALRLSVHARQPAKHGRLAGRRRAHVRRVEVRDGDPHHAAAVGAGDPVVLHPGVRYGGGDFRRAAGARRSRPASTRSRR